MPTHNVDRVLILSAFRLLHLRYLVNPIPAGRLKPLFFMSSFSCPFVCLLPIVTISFFRIGESFFIAAMDEAIRRREGLHKTAERSAKNCPLHLVNPSTTRFLHLPTSCPIYYIPLLFPTPVFMDSSPIDSLINKLYPLIKKLTADNVFLLNLIANKKCIPHAI